MTCHFPKAFPIKCNTGYELSLICRLRDSPKGPAPLALWGDLPKEAMLEMQFKSDSHLELQGNPYAPVTDMFQDHWRSPITHPWYIIWEGQKADSFTFQMSDTLLLLLILLSLKKGPELALASPESLCRPSWSQTCNDPLVPGSHVLELQVHATMLGLADAS